MKQRENPLADGPKIIGVVRANNGILAVWRASIWGLEGGVTFDGRTMVASPETARIAIKDMLPPSGIDHYFDPRRGRSTKHGMVNTCECGCGLVMVQNNKDTRFLKDVSELQESAATE
jgi:hypothetical protein